LIKKLEISVLFRLIKSKRTGVRLLLRQSKVEISENAAGLFAVLGTARSHRRIGRRVNVGRTGSESGCQYINGFELSGQGALRWLQK
jgi:hypothetical protein